VKAKVTTESKAKNYSVAQLSNVRNNGNYMTYQSLRNVVQIHTLYGGRKADEQTSEVGCTRKQV